VGGLGSGRVVWRLAVDQFRRLDIGELCDGGRITRQPTGEVVWYDDDGGLCAQLRYDFDRHKQDGKLYLLLSDYGRRPQAFEIDVCSGLATCALCFCGEAVRHLYTAPEDLFVSDVTPPFACRHCWRLIYRRKTNGDLEYVRSKAGPALEAYEALPQRVRHRPWRHYVEEPPAELAAELAYELPLAPQELRLWSLRLRAVGLSYRQIARLTASSKSTVARYCAAGRDGIDLLALTRERLACRPSLPPLPEDASKAEFQAYLKAVDPDIRALGLGHRPPVEHEERVVLPAGAVH
jgi:hypothetical protein